MGTWLSKWLTFGMSEKRIVMVGLDAAGKTTVLYNLKLAEVVHTIPTIGFNVEKVQYGSINFEVWDVGGQDKIRRLWHHYYSGCDAVIFVVDSNDSERLSDACNELQKILETDELKDASLLVFANKQDLPNAKSVSEVAEALHLYRLPASRKWFIQPCSATKSEGLYDGLNWLSKSLA